MLTPGLSPEGLADLATSLQSLSNEELALVLADLDAGEQSKLLELVESLNKGKNNASQEVSLTKAATTRGVDFAIQGVEGEGSLLPYSIINNGELQGKVRFF